MKNQKSASLRISKNYGNLSFLRSLLLLGFFSLFACKLGPDYQEPKLKLSQDWDSENKFVSKDRSLAESSLCKEDLKLEKDKRKSVKTGAESCEKESKIDWWQRFDDPILTELISKALAHNFDIKIAYENIKKAKAESIIANADLYPDLTMSSTALREGLSYKSGDDTSEENAFSSNFDVSWEIDFFGKNRRSKESYKAFMQAVEADKDLISLVITAEIAENYFTLRNIQNKKELLQERIKILAKIAELIESKFKLGEASEIELNQSRINLASIRANMPSLEGELKSSLYHLSILIGKEPEATISLLAPVKNLKIVKDIVPVGLKSDLLKNRPDIKKAERNLAGYTASIGVAKAELFPSFSLTGSAGLSSLFFGDLFTRGASNYTFGSEIDWSVFKAGSLLANLKDAKSDAAIALLNYQKIVIVALEESEKSLNDYGHSWQKYQQSQIILDAQSKIFSIIKKRYEIGEDDYLTFLAASKELNLVKSQIADDELQIMINLVKLYKVLGG